MDSDPKRAVLGFRFFMRIFQFIEKSEGIKQKQVERAIETS